MWMNHIKFNGWEVEDKDNNENKSKREEKRVYIDEIPFL